MSETKTQTRSQVDADRVIDALYIAPEYHAWTDAVLEEGRPFLIGDGGPGHIVVSDGSSLYRLTRDRLAAFKEYTHEIAFGHAQQPDCLVWSWWREAGAPPTAQHVVTLLEGPRGEQCTVLPGVPAFPETRSTNYLSLMFCVSDSGRVATIQSRYMLPLDDIDGLTFWFSDDPEDPIRVMQGDLVIAAVMPAVPTQPGELSDLQHDLARAAYAAYREYEVRP